MLYHVGSHLDEKSRIVCCQTVNVQTTPTMMLLSPIEVVSGLSAYEQVLHINCDQGCSTFDQKVRVSSHRTAQVLKNNKVSLYWRRFRNIWV